MITPRLEVAATSIATHGGRFGLDESALSAVTSDFSVCLNAFGPAAVVVRAMQNSRPDEYPDPQCRAPRSAAAERWKRPVAEIAFGAGAAELIHAVCFAYLRPGDIVFIAGPAFGEYERAASLCGARSITVSGCKHDADGAALSSLVAQIEVVRPRLVFIATPMSPTGEALTKGDIERIAQACLRSDSLLVLDQAYDAFAADPLGTPALAGHPNVFHIRSLTKDHALAGVRVAFGVADPSVIGAIDHVRVPWAASAAAQAAGVAAMTDEAQEHVARTTALLRQEASRLVRAATALGMRVGDSSTHFFLISPGRSRVRPELLLSQSGILVRDCASFGLPGRIRVAARTPEDNDLLITAFKRALEPSEQ
jgi:histidinol-phosphate/aromatic aminotransferase/cobyric acid decarboxylase-like protein